MLQVCCGDEACPSGPSETGIGGGFEHACGDAHVPVRSLPLLGISNRPALPEVEFLTSNMLTSKCSLKCNASSSLRACCQYRHGSVEGMAPRKENGHGEEERPFLWPPSPAKSPEPKLAAQKQYPPSSSVIRPSIDLSGEGVQRCVAPCRSILQPFSL